MLQVKVVPFQVIEQITKMHILHMAKLIIKLKIVT